MKLKDQKKSWKISIAKGDILITLESMLHQLDPDSPRVNELYALIGRFNTLNKTYELARIRYDEFSIGLERIRMAVLELIDKIEKTDLTTIVEQKTEVLNSLSKEDIIQLIESYLPKPYQGGHNTKLIENSILILSDKEGMYTLKSYFNHRNFKNVQFEDWDNFEFHMLKEIDIVIMNNMDVPTTYPDSPHPNPWMGKRISTIRLAVETSSCYFIHYGNFLYVVNEYKQIIAANSIFTLFSRVKEIADFSNVYNINLKKD